MQNWRKRLPRETRRRRAKSTIGTVPLVRAILFEATGSMAETQDLVQEVFLRALGRLCQLRRPEMLCGWIVGIARREGIQFRRRIARERTRHDALDQRADRSVRSGGPAFD